MKRLITQTVIAAVSSATPILAEPLEGQWQVGAALGYSQASGTTYDGFEVGRTVTVYFGGLVHDAVYAGLRVDHTAVTLECEGPYALPDDRHTSHLDISAAARLFATRPDGPLPIYFEGRAGVAQDNFNYWDSNRAVGSVLGTGLGVQIPLGILAAEVALDMSRSSYGLRNEYSGPPMGVDRSSTAGMRVSGRLGVTARFD